MRQIVWFALLSLALAGAGHAADKCKDADGKTIACPPHSSSGEVTVAAPISRPHVEPAPVGPRPDLAIPAMTTARCKDGHFDKSPMPTSACSVHGGVDQWMR